MNTHQNKQCLQLKIEGNYSNGIAQWPHPHYAKLIELK